MGNIPLNNLLVEQNNQSISIITYTAIANETGKNKKVLNKFKDLRVQG